MSQYQQQQAGWEWSHDDEQRCHAENISEQASTEAEKTNDGPDASAV